MVLLCTIGIIKKIATKFSKNSYKVFSIIIVYKDAKVFLGVHLLLGMICNEQDPVLESHAIQNETSLHSIVESKKYNSLPNYMNP